MIEVAEPRRVMLAVGRHNSLAVEVGLVHKAGLKVGHYTAAVGTGLGAVVLRKVAVEKGDTLAAVDICYGEELHMAAAEAEDTLVVEGDCVKQLGMGVVGVAGSHGCTGPAVRMLPGAVTEAGDPVRS